MRRLLFLLTLAFALAGATTGANAAATAVSIAKSGFSPTSVTIPAGDGVTWTNGDAARHQVVADDGSFSSPVLASKQSFSHVFKAGGTFSYHDGLHPALNGKITVIPPRTVWITSNGFVPSTISIKTGQTVTWTNRSNANQQVLADDASFASPVIPPKASYSHAFPTAGTRMYHDALQPTLTGTVVVSAPPAGESITLDSSASVATYGGSLELTGAVANGTPGEKVTLTAHPQSLGGKFVRSVLIVTAGPNGAFSATVHPLVRTIYTAETAKTRSDPVAIDVRPGMRLQLFDRARAIVRVSAARSFVHRTALLQVLRRRSGIWVSIARVRLTRAVATVSPTVVSSGIVRLRVRHGLRLRVLLPASQAVPGYVSGTSNAIRR